MKHGMCLSLSTMSLVKLKNKTILITGCAGFIGSNMTDCLLAQGYRVIGIDNLSGSSLTNLSAALKNKRFSFEKIDCLDKKKLGRFCGKKIDIFLHLAAYKIPLYSSALLTLKVNTQGTENILELAMKNRAKVIFSSTSDVYGKSPVMPFSEDSDLLLGNTRIKRWAYAVSKIFDEHLILAYAKDYRLPFIILRYFNTYGPRHPVDAEKVRCGPHTIFIESALDQKPITIYGDGRQKRCFCYIDDTVKGTLLAIENKNAWGEIFNIGNDKTEISIFDLACSVLKETGRKRSGMLNFIPFKKAFKDVEDVSRRIPDIGKAKKLLGFYPEISNDEGVKRTIYWHRSLRK